LSEPSKPPPLLSVERLQARYGDFQALWGIDLQVNAGEVVALIGANGAGKTTLLRCLAGLHPVLADSVRLHGQPIGGMQAHRVAALGVALVPEGRRLFPSLSVQENLLMGASTGRAGGWSLEAVFALFPVLRERRNQAATTLSGGQQQMVAIARALMANPELLLCDEISLGLAPAVVREIYQRLPELRRGGTAVVVVEQDIRQALAVADRVYCLLEGRVALHGTPASLKHEALSQAYFGV
jgi:branched-chain amino acid transport system ATP-binding protein